MLTNSAFCVLVLAFACISNVMPLDYNDLAEMGFNCPSKLSCSVIDSSFNRRNCECDRECASFNDCCVDAPTRRAASRNRGNPPVCMQFGDDLNMGAYAIQTCSRDFSGHADVQSKCQNHNNVSDPLMASPVTDTTNRLTYRNIYCAECNNAATENLRPWLIKMDCKFDSTHNFDEKFIFENIQYRPNLSKWGVNVGENFQICDILFEKPESLRNSVRLCRANVVSGCPRNWRRQSVKRNCESYTAVVYTTTVTAYRNPHCAQCHGQTQNSISCDRSVSPKKKKPFSFAVLLDVNTSDGDRVGVSRPSGVNCENDETYDPYFKKCRNTFCAIPGYQKVDGKCRKP